MFSPTAAEMLDVYAPRVSRWDDDKLMAEIRKAEANGPEITLATKPDRLFRCTMLAEMLKRNESRPQSQLLRL